MKNVDNWEVNISGYCSHVTSVIEKKKLKKNLGPDSNLTRDSNFTRDSKFTRATSKLCMTCSVHFLSNNLIRYLSADLN